ncbi:MAG TPA: DNA repair protein RecO [Methylomirabilota bacterium]|jgi:DNA repair protein RecO (recombination protein O)|nr:DNA repair protein RecO [Methylomirabilota bacterium]
MALYKTESVVIGRRALGESDRLVEFYTREFGKLKGVAKSARRPRSRFGSALEPFTLGQLVFFDSGRSELVRIDHFDIIQAFVRAREDLERLGRAAWVVECLSGLSADRDPQPALFRLLVRTLGALEVSARPAWVAACFGLRAVDLFGQRPRLDRCATCGRPFPFAPAALDIAAGGLICVRCGAGPGIALSGAVVGTLKRLRGLRWEEALRLPVAGSLEGEICAAVEDLMARLAGQLPRSSRFMAQVRRSLLRVAEPTPRSRGR